MACVYVCTQNIQINAQCKWINLALERKAQQFSSKAEKVFRGLAGPVVHALSPSTLAEGLAGRSLVEGGLVYRGPGQPGLVMYIAACL